MAEEKKIVKTPHNVIMEDRSRVMVTGVNDVDSFDEQPFQRGDGGTEHGGADSGPDLHRQPEAAGRLFRPPVPLDVHVGNQLCRSDPHLSFFPAGRRGALPFIRSVPDFPSVPQHLQAGDLFGGYPLFRHCGFPDLLFSHRAMQRGDQGVCAAGRAAGLFDLPVHAVGPHPLRSPADLPVFEMFFPADLKTGEGVRRVYMEKSGASARIYQKIPQISGGNGKKGLERS